MKRLLLVMVGCVGGVAELEKISAKIERNWCQRRAF